MNFLAPLFLVGALAIAGPIIFHLIRRTTREKTPFSTLMFLEPTPPRVTRRSRLENLWLLALRCLVLLLLALGFARPFFRGEAAQAPAITGNKRIVVLVDTSASMRREDLWQQAREKALAAVERAELPDTLALVAFARAPLTLVGFEEWRQSDPAERVALCRQRLDAISPSWSGTNLGTAILHAAELIEANAQDHTTGEIIVVSDLQEGARVDGLQGHEWGPQTIVKLEPVTARKPTNAGLAWLAGSEEAADGGTSPEPRLRITNASNSEREQFRILPGTADSREPIEAYAPPGQTRTVRLPALSPSPEQWQIHGDDTDFDNTVWLFAPPPQQVRLLFLGNDDPENTKELLYYLRRAFPPTRQQTVEILARKGGSTIPAEELRQAQMLVLGEGITEPDVEVARQFAQTGRIVLLPFISTGSANVLARLANVPTLAVTEASGEEYALLGQIDFQHPVFAPFADPRFSDFTKIHFWKHRKIEPAALPEARVIARFDRGDPALVQVPLGMGSIIALTTTWRPVDSQLALSSKFVPLMHALLEQSSRLPARRAQYFIDNEVPLAGPGPFRVQKPDGTTVDVAPGQPFTGADQPGVYTVQPDGHRFVVNLPPEESQTAPLPADRLASLDLPMDRPEKPTTESEERKALAQAGELEARQKVWRWLLLAAAAVLLLETLFAAKLSRVFNRSPEAQT